MINIKELSVENYLRVAKEGLCIKNGTIIKINGIDAENKFIEKGLVGVISCHPLDKYQFDGGIWLAYLEPIEITPEILEKNGFEKREFIDEVNCKEEYWIYCDDYYSLVISEINDGLYKVEHHSEELINLIEQLYISYIHQLQNALTLCGINKNIEL